MRTDTMHSTADQERAVVRTLLALTIVTGLVDAVSYLGLDRVFTANMTGNVVFLGFAAVRTTGVSALRAAVALCAFACGSVGGGLVINRMRRAPEAQLVLAMYVETILLVATTIVTLCSAQPLGPAPVYVVIILLAIAMGLRNAVIRRQAIPDFTTTVLTSTVTDLAAESVLAGGPGARTGRRLIAIGAMVAGAAVGAILLRAFGISAPLGIATVLVFASALYLRRSRP